jgi:SAM-dependent MidA family methyltransferase
MEAPEGAVHESCAAAGEIAALLSTRIARDGGALLALDYGPAESGFGDSLQALAAGQPADPLAEPGSVDITAHVDFAALVRAAPAARAYGPLPMGPVPRRRPRPDGPSRHVAARSLRRRAQILSAAQRMGGPEGLGRLFKALPSSIPNSGDGAFRGLMAEGPDPPGQAGFRQRLLPPGAAAFRAGGL